MKRAVRDSGAASEAHRARIVARSARKETRAPTPLPEQERGRARVGK